MPIFKYKAFNKNRKIVEGLVESFNEVSAGNALRERGYSLISIKEKKASGFNDLIALLNRVSAKDLVVFSRQFAVMVSANVSLVQAMRIIAEQTENPKFKKIVLSISDEVDSGSRLSDALGKRPEVFSDFYINVVKSGETSGKLDEVLTYLADEMEKDFDIMAKVRGAMVYPVILFLVLIGMGTFMMIFVVPQLTNIIAEGGAEIPWPTKFLIGLSAFLSAYWWALLLAIAGLTAVFVIYIRTASGKRNFDFFKLYVPIFGELFRLIYIVRFTRSMGTLLAGGVTISKSLSVSAEVVGNEIYKDLIYKTLKEVEDGNSISEVFGMSNVVPKMVPQMMSVGEKTGKMDLVLEKISDFYSRQINNSLANLMTALEPIIIVIMGVVVAFVVFAFVMPMYSMQF